jgi:hypothetical protein
MLVIVGDGARGDGDDLEDEEMAGWEVDKSPTRTQWTQFSPGDHRELTREHRARAVASLRAAASQALA